MLLDGLFLVTNLFELGIDDIVDEVLRHIVLFSVMQDRVVQLILECDVQLILETMSPVLVFGQVLHRSHEAALQELFGQVEALELVHGLDLLLSPSTSIVESLVLLLDARDLTLDLLFPVVVVALLTLLVLSFEFADLLQLGFFLNFQ